MQNNLINSSNAVTASKIMLDFDKSAIQEQFSHDAQIWIFNVKHTLNYHLKLKTGNTIVLPINKSFKDEYHDSILALAKYANNLFDILNPKAQRELIQRLSTPSKASLNK